MQVELAQLQYLMPRLIGKGLVLSRQGGGIGTSGPGETKLETDRRRIRDKIEKLKEDLRGVKAHRALARKKRTEKCRVIGCPGRLYERGQIDVVERVDGSRADCCEWFVHDARSVVEIVEAAQRRAGGVVGYGGILHNLPHGLIEAFKATLEEVVESDLLIHVIDISHPKIREHYNAVRKVLEELGCHEKPTVVGLE
jgi:GTP-binding protein HflX